MKKLLTLTFASLVIVAPMAQGQTCVDAAEDTLDTCLDTAAASCIEASAGACAVADIQRLVTSDTISQKVTNSCCNKKNKGLKLACFTVAINALKRAKLILPTDAYTHALADLQEFKDSVKSTGQCPADD